MNTPDEENLADGPLDAGDCSGFKRWLIDVDQR